MIGAYAYGWSFGAEPVAGVTPIENMIDDLERPIPPAAHAARQRCSPAGKQAGKLGTLASPLAAQPAPACSTRPVRRRRSTLRPRRPRQAARGRAAPTRSAPEGSAPIAAASHAAPGRRHERTSRSRWRRPARAARPRAAAGRRRRPQQGRRRRRADALRRRRRHRRAARPRRHVGDGPRHRHARRGRQARRVRSPDDGRRRRAPCRPAIGKVLWFLASEQRSFKIGEAARSLGALVKIARRRSSIDATAQGAHLPGHGRDQGRDGRAQDASGTSRSRTISS